MDNNSFLVEFDAKRVEKRNSENRDKKEMAIDLLFSLIEHRAELQIKPSLFFFFSVVLYYQSKGIPVPSQRKLANHIGVVDRQVRNFVEEAREKKLLNITTTKSSRAIGEYDFTPLIEKIEEIKRIKAMYKEVLSR